MKENLKSTRPSFAVFLLLATFLLSFSSCSNDKSASNSEEELAGNQMLSEQSSALASWEEAPRTRIMDWVSAVTKEGTADFIPVADRIAVFDNDGTLWSEQPIYFQLAFAMDEVKRMAPEHPEWNENPSIKALIDGDMIGFLSGGEKALMETLAMTHSGMSAEEFDQHVRNWINTATHPKTGKHYNEMIFNLCWSYLII